MTSRLCRNGVPHYCPNCDNTFRAENDASVIDALDGKLLARVVAAEDHRGVLAGQLKAAQWVIDNIYTIARRESARAELRPEMWAHVLRLCEKVGAQSRTVGILRTEDAVDPQVTDTGKPSTRDEVS
jgi:hypothetical protein